MNSHIEVRPPLRQAQRWQQALFAIACAQRVAPVFRVLAAPSSVEIFNRALEAAWNGVAIGGIAEARKAIGLLPEAAIDDSHRPDYYAGFMLGILKHALDTIASSNAAEAADFASCLSIDLCASLDAVRMGSNRLVIDPDKSPPPGELEVAETMAQAETLRALLSAREPSAKLHNYVRESADTASQTLFRMIPESTLRERGSN